MAEQVQTAEQAFRVEQRRISDLHPHPKNPRTHPEEQLAILRTSLRTHGQQKPIVIQPDNTILAGHGLVEAAKLEGWTHVSCHTYDGPYPEAFLAMDNHSAELAVDDPVALAQLLQQLNSAAQLEYAGYDDAGLAELLQSIEAMNPVAPPEEGEIPEPQEGPTRVQPGEIWGLGKVVKCPKCGRLTDVKP